ncbi:protein of unknown function DUF477 [Sphingobium chlorophenolicum L-1]|uniref:TPM domain-containing protein n=1 Tax=Sphingobium chlorophenolicum L-1 TaxID=690566 RepID=F6EYX4_SPHCR|nr:TPM domain-containing protein [Sphingobium chlorophenolicum]AEG48366.1 protein of unknown function DUF477 [Sphingobium chlorophenolicum L-1]
MTALISRILLCLLLVCSFAGEARADAGPAVVQAGRVTDEAGLFTVEQKRVLSEKLERLEQSTRHQMVVVTVSSLGGAEIGPFTTALGNEWGIGRKGHNDGVVLLVAPQEQLAQISVGVGLEAVLPDELCQSIMNERMIPRFREGDLFGGVDAGVDALIERLD